MVDIIPIMGYAIYTTLFLKLVLSTTESNWRQSGATEVALNATFLEIIDHYVE